MKSKRPPIGSYEETRLFSLECFNRLSPTQKLQWLDEMAAFIDEANPEVRLRRLGLLSAGHRRNRTKS